MNFLIWLKNKKNIIISCIITGLVSALLTFAFMVYNDGISVFFAKQIINRYYVDDVDSKKLNEGIVNGMLHSLDDRFSLYIPSDYGFDRFNSDVTGEFEGIGVTLKYVDSNSQVLEVFDSSPAQESGILVGDIIVSSDDIDLKGKTPSEVSDILRGAKNTKVNLTVLRDGNLITINDIERREINAPSVNYKSFEDGIDYIYISSFDGDTDKELSDKLKDISETSRGLIVDLRDNPGGRLDVVLKSLDLFLDKGKLLIARYKNDNEEVYESTDGTEYDKPVVIIVNSNSASASEIFAQAMKERGRAEVVGVNTYGKGSIQRTFMLPDNAAINLTVGRFYSPDGNVIDKVGVAPDYVAELADELNDTEIREIAFEQDTQLIKAIQLLK